MSMRWNLFRSLIGAESGSSCRCCSVGIPRNDHFGVSEGVCLPCRAAGR